MRALAAEGSAHTQSGCAIFLGGKTKERMAIHAISGMNCFSIMANEDVQSAQRTRIISKQIMPSCGKDAASLAYARKKTSHSVMYTLLLSVRRKALVLSRPPTRSSRRAGGYGTLNGGGPCSCALGASHHASVEPDLRARSPALALSQLASAADYGGGPTILHLSSCKVLARALYPRLIQVIKIKIIPPAREDVPFPILTLRPRLMISH